MRRFLGDAPVGWKLTVISLAATAFPILLAGGVLFVAGNAEARRERGTSLAAIAEVLSPACLAPLGARDAAAAADTLGGLGSLAAVTRAGLYTSDGALLASYTRPAADEPPPRAPRAGGPTEAEGHVTLTREVLAPGGAPLGSLFLETDLSWLARERRARGSLLAVVGLSACLLAVLIASRLQRAVSEPIRALLEVARNVAATGNYALRAGGGGRDEIGALVEDFNRMLAQAQERDAELRAAKEAAEEASRSKSAFLASVSHELRTPLNAIIGYSEILQEEVRERGASGLLPDLEKIHASGRHLLALINDILDLSKIEAGKVELLVESFDAAALVRTVGATVQPLVAARGNRLELAIGSEVGNVRADVTKVRQILLNLLSNAAKFTENGTVCLGVELSRGPERDELVFRVRDSGIGIAPEQMGRLFRAFAQADATVSRNYGGTGLGLALSKRYAELLGGELSAESEMGKGSTFTFRLPLATRETRTPSRPSLLGTRRSDVRRVVLPAYAEPGPDARLVLVVEDDAAARGFLVRVLNAEGLRVVSAENGAEGIRLARELKPALVTLDLLMPQEDGLSVLAALKADPALGAVPVLLLATGDDPQHGLTLGAAGHLVKPVDRDRLAEVLHRFASGRRPPRVLIADADEMTRTVLRRAVEREGGTVVEAADGRGALDVLASSDVDLVLLDVLIPGVDAFELLRWLRSAPGRGPLTPVVILAARQLTTADRARLAGAVEAAAVAGEGGAPLEEEIRRLVRRYVHADARNGKEAPADAQDPGRR